MCGRATGLETWEALEVLRAEGLVRAIGVSNFEPKHLEDILTVGKVVPAVNQIELHPRLQQSHLRSLHDRYGIATQAWSPLAKGQLLTSSDTGPHGTATWHYHCTTRPAVAPGPRQPDHPQDGNCGTHAREPWRTTCAVPR
ncbi:hypothetical protein F7O44_20820 [Phytoactinopolyspora sp. XMNu-373]|uniref:NADP-dependent oxidoreductase domain-containing protein n=1 Tax=Phytoactinopolyspora mesophila TaxID=2650750 RepID=A0A7K3M880_9ACTN|nr:hypothetical protein [Phytoactinopolyspora mesophila]